ncbi:MAG: hypothetical protein ACKO3W_05030 [bacterium]
MLEGTTQTSGTIVDAAGTARSFAPFVHAPAPDLVEPGTHAAYAAIARRTRREGATNAFAPLDSTVRRGDFLARRGAYLAATVAGAAAIGLILFGFAMTAELGGRPGGGPLEPLLMLTPLGVAIAAFTAWRHFFVRRRRIHAATTPLLELGLCASCGQALRGASIVEHADVGVGERAGTSLCACAECGARWPIGASQAPFHPDGTSLGTAFPTVEGPARWRSRRALARALRAMPEDFVVDAGGLDRYVATGAGVRAGSGTIAVDLAADGARVALYSIPAFIGVVAVLVLFGVLVMILQIGGALGGNLRSVLSFIELTAVIYIAVAAFDASRRRSRARRVRKAVRAALAAETCPTCMNGLVRVPATTLYEPCSCC